MKRALTRVWCWITRHTESVYPIVQLQLHYCNRCKSTWVTRRPDHEITANTEATND